MRHKLMKGCSLAFVLLVLALPAWAGVPKVVVAEDFTATWCTYCPAADCGLQTLYNQHSDTFIVLEEHCSPQDPFTIPGTSARESMYGVTGYPTVRIDGKYAIVGAGSCSGAYSGYLSRYNLRMSETGGVSPVNITGSFGTDGTVGTINATFSLLDPVTLGSVQATFFVYEDDVQWCCGYGGQSVWNELVRVVKNDPVTLTNVGDEAVVNEAFTVGPDWNPDNLHVVVILQETGGQRTVIQSARLTMISDFALQVEQRVRSVPSGNGTALFWGTVQNLSLSSDVVTLSLDQTFGWPADFQVAGDPNWYSSSDAVPLAAGESKGVTIRVETDGTRGIGEGTISGLSTNSGRERSTGLRVFNGSYSIMLVDDDAGGTYEAPFVTGLDALGYLYDDWDVHGGHADAGPVYNDLAGFDAVIWETGYTSYNVLLPSDLGALTHYLDAGGKLYLDSMDLLSTSPPGYFGTGYLGIQTFTNNTMAHTVTGVPGDPITDGLVLPLTFVGGEAGNRVDTVNPSSTASTIFFSEINTSNALRNTLAGGGQVVFSTIPQDAFPQGATLSNDSQTVLQRILDWFLPSPASVSEPVAGATRILGATPNPFQPRTTLRFGLSANAAARPVRLIVTDASGRLVRTLIDGLLPSGVHSATWDGRSDGGREAPSGVYFARLQSLDGATSAKLVLAR